MHHDAKFETNLQLSGNGIHPLVGLLYAWGFETEHLAPLISAELDLEGAP